MKRMFAAAVVTALLVGGVAGQADAAPKKYANCTQLNKAYPHGVGRSGAVDKTSGAKVTNFTRNNAVYNANTGRDRDKDKIACEKR